MKFPLFVKGVATENSIGIDEHSLVTNRRQLKDKVRQINTDLKQPALVEEFIGGREFAVAILPGKVNRTMPLLEIEYDALPAQQALPGLQRQVGDPLRLVSEDHPDPSKGPD